MITPIRWRVLGAGQAALLLAAATLHAQEPSKATTAPKADAPAATRSNDPARRVPSYFGQIGLTPEQREAIYKIRAEHQARITELEKQVAELRAEELGACEGVLTETQKQLLAQRRKAAAAKKASEPEKTSMRPQ
jgi:hypothetical protein